MYTKNAIITMRNGETDNNKQNRYLYCELLNIHD